ncbi:uncharacterized protein [Diadema antillarum]|uniref:uncharacterized protein n=1 Tax=Diadema antillarum TaxID=105358 RepID=UPI003A84EC01
MANAMDQSNVDAKQGVIEGSSKTSAQNKFLREKMESTLRKAREKVAQVQQEVDSDRFDKAWERVYGNKQYRPSWVGKLQNRGSPPKVRHTRKKQEPIKEEKKEDDDFFSNQVEGIPEQFRAKKTLEPLKIKGKIVPNEQELDKWRKEIDTGETTNNAVVKKTNVKGWIDDNQFWKHDKNFLAAKPKKRFDSHKPPENQKINTERYDMVAKYENKVQNAELKIGNSVVPRERDLKKWGDELEIPDDLTTQDFSIASSKKQVATTSSSKESEGQKKWNRVLKTADVPNFLAYNGYW